MEEMNKLIEIAGNLREARIRYSRLNWAKYTTGFDFGVNEAYRKLHEVLSDPASWAAIQRLRNRGLEPLDSRMVDIMELAYKPYHLSDRLNELSLLIQKKTSSLSAVLNTHRCTLDGKEITSPDIDRILSTEPDKHIRKKAFLVRTQVNQPLVEAGFIELLDLRREYAEEYGTADFVQYSLRQQELDPDMFSSWTGEIRSVLPMMNSIRSEFADEFIGSPDPKPWDIAYIAAKIAPQLNAAVDMSGFLDPISELFAGFGFDISGMNITYDVFPRKNKSEWGYNFPIETGVDSRILANVRDRYFQFGVLLHETGHALHSFLLDPDQIILNMGVSGIVSEGVANLFGRFQKNRLFYSRVLRENLEETEMSFQRVKKWNRANQLRRVSSILFDQLLYRSSIESIDDIHHLLWQCNRDVLGEEPYAEEPVWARTIHHTTHPIYLHNYLLGDLVCDMLEQVFCSREAVGEVTDRPLEFGKFLLDEIMAVSGRYSFPELFRQISGEELTLRFLTDRLRMEAVS
jgi:oligoendopeptidase F